MEYADYGDEKLKHTLNFTLPDDGGNPQQGYITSTDKVDLDSVNYRIGIAYRF